MLTLFCDFSHDSSLNMTRCHLLRDTYTIESLAINIRAEKSVRMWKTLASKDICKNKDLCRNFYKY